MQNRRVLFFIESLAGGGAEKVLSTLVKHIDQTQYDVTVCAISGGGKYEKEVASSARYISILKEPSSYTGLSKLAYLVLYKSIYHWLPSNWVYRWFVPQGYDVEVAFVEGFVTKLIAASSNKKAKKIAWVHCDLEHQPWPLQQGIFRNLEQEREAYLCFDKVVCVSSVVEHVMRQHYGLAHAITIHNPVDDVAVRHFAQESLALRVDAKQFNIVSVGRLEKVKGYDLLLPIIAHLVNGGMKVRLYIVGDGSVRTALEQQVSNLGISENVTFTGFLKNPYALMSQMDLFVCSSRAEGFSLVIAESLILGVPVISMNCSGPNELIGKNEYGILCDTYEQLEEEIVAAIEGKRIPCSIPPMVDLQHTMNEVHHLLDS